MGKFLQRYGILFFFCAMMGGIIMVDSIFAIAFTDKERGLESCFIQMSLNQCKATHLSKRQIPQ